MTPEQLVTAQVYAGLSPDTRRAIWQDLIAFSKTESEPMIRAGILIAAGRFVEQTTRLEREKKRA